VGITEPVGQVVVSCHGVNLAQGEWDRLRSAASAAVPMEWRETGAVLSVWSRRHRARSGSITTKARRYKEELALAHRLTIYDAAYLALAEQRGCPLFAADKRLMTAAEATGIERCAGEVG